MGRDDADKARTRSVGLFVHSETCLWLCSGLRRFSTGKRESMDDDAVLRRVLESGDLEQIRSWFAAGRRDANVLINNGDRFSHRTTILQFFLTHCSRFHSHDLGPVIRYLASQGADVNKACALYRAPIMLSLIGPGSTSKINALIDCGADVNTCEDGGQVDGHSILMQCADCVGNQTQIARLLVRRGADVFLRDSDGHDAEYYARRESSRNIGYNPHATRRSQYAALASFLADVKRAGSYRKYLKEPRVELAWLRLLCGRGRATPLADPALARLFGIPDESTRAVPKEVFWHVLAYWRSSCDDE